MNIAVTLGTTSQPRTKPMMSHFQSTFNVSSLTDPDIDSPESLANQDKKQESDDDDCP